VKLFTILMAETGDGPADLISLPDGEVLFQKLLLELDPRSDDPGGEGCKPVFGFILKGEREKAQP
jgi:hypothetical protein